MKRLNLRKSEEAGSLGQSRTELAQMRLRAAFSVVVVVIVCFGLWMKLSPLRGSDDLLLVGFDASRDYLSEAGQLYVQSRGARAGRIRSHHSGSVDQAERLARGLAADIVFLASEAEMEAVCRQTGCVDAYWKSAFPYGGSPVYSTIVMVVRNGSEFGVSDWQDLYRLSTRIAMPDPRLSGAGRYAYLAVLADAIERHGTNLRRAEAEVRSLLMDIKLIPHGAHTAMDVFLRSKGLDVFLTWESEALRLAEAEAMREYRIVYPTISIKAEPVVAIMFCQTERRHTTETAMSFIDFLYSSEGQNVAIRNGLRPRSLHAEPEKMGRFAEVQLREVEAVFGSWETVWRDHLGPEGSFAYAMAVRSAREGGME